METIVTENPFSRLAESMARMRANAEGPFVELKPFPCHRTREHVPHTEFSDPGAPFACPGVGNFVVVVTSPADPFAGLD